MSPLTPYDGHREAPHREEAHARAEELLTRAESCEDEAGRHRLQQEAVLLCVDLADAVAHRYRDRGIDVEDLVQVARMGLVKAAGRFRSGVGESFAAYAVPTISGEVKRHFRDSGWMVRPPRRLQERGAALVSAENRLQQDLGRTPTREELAESLDTTPEEVAAAQQSQSAFSLLSLDAPTPQETPVGDSVSDPRDAYAAVDRRDALHHALEGLDDRQRTILRLRFVEEWTQSQIGAELGVTQMQISRLLSSILSRLHDDLEEADEPAPDTPPPERGNTPAPPRHRVQVHHPRGAERPLRRAVRWGYRLSTWSPPDRILVNARLAEKAGFDELLLVDRPADGDERDRAFVWSVLGALSGTTHLPITVSIDLSRSHLDVTAMARAVRTARSVLPSGLVLAVDLGDDAETEGAQAHAGSSDDAVVVLRRELDGQSAAASGRARRGDWSATPGLHVVVRGPRSLALACRYADGICSPAATAGQVETFRRSRGPHAATAAELTVAWDEETGGDAASDQDHPGRVHVHDPRESVARAHRLERTGVDVIHVGTVASHAPDLIRAYGEDVIHPAS